MASERKKKVHAWEEGKETLLCGFDVDREWTDDADLVTCKNCIEELDVRVKKGHVVVAKRKEDTALSPVPVESMTLRLVEEPPVPAPPGHLQLGDKTDSRTVIPLPPSEPIPPPRFKPPPTAPRPAGWFKQLEVQWWRLIAFVASLFS